MRIIGTGAVLFLVGACHAPGEMTETERAQIEAELIEFAEAWMDVWGENDCEKAAAFLHPDRLAVLHGARVLNRSEWLEACAPVVAAREAYSVIWTDMEVRVLTPNVAILIGTYSSTTRYTDGREGHHPAIAQAGLVERTRSGWVFATLASDAGLYEEIEEG
jgi:uncharacterized protein (TIGR02246 family)